MSSEESTVDGKPSRRLRLRCQASVKQKSKRPKMPRNGIGGSDRVTRKALSAGLAVAALTVGLGLAFADDQVGNGLLGISGGGAPRGISGGGAPRNVEVDGLFANSFAAAMGPVEGVQSDGAVATVTVAGQGFSISASDAASLQVGDYVVVADTFNEAATVGAIDETYVPGVSVIRVRGRVQSVSADTAKVVVNGLVVDYAAALTNSPSLSIANGSLVEFSGTQPTPGGTVLVVR